MSDVTAKITAKGLHKGELVVIECIEYDGDDDDKRRVKLLKNGIEDNHTTLLFDEYVWINYSEGAKLSHAYNPIFNSVAAYWLVMKKYFDEPPEITTEGDVTPVEYTKEELQYIRF